MKNSRWCDTAVGHLAMCQNRANLTSSIVPSRSFSLDLSALGRLSRFASRQHGYGLYSVRRHHCSYRWCPLAYAARVTMLVREAIGDVQTAEHDIIDGPNWARRRLHVASKRILDQS
jgi:hypothetical protein